MEIKDLIDKAEQNWHKPIGLVFTVAAALIFVALIVSTTKASSTAAVIAISIIIVSTLLIWFYSNQTPKTHKGKVGFVVCIQCSNEDEQKIIREDFILTLRKLLKEGLLGSTFHFIEIPKYISETINDVEDAQNLKVKTRCHFLIYGRVRLRKIDEKDCHIIELDGLVAHKPIKKEVSANLAKEFSELFPRRVKIPTENDLLSLNFTSDWTEIVAKYIIGIASYCSFDVNYAELLFSDVQNKIGIIETDFPVIIKLKQRLPIRFSEIYIAKSMVCAENWRKTQDKKALSELRDNLQKVSPILHDNYDVLLLQSIEAFLNGRRIKEAIEYTKKCSQFDSPVWHFNLAFLEAYQNNLAGAIRQYRKAANYEILPKTLSDIEDFIFWLIEEEPDKYQYHYCLGFFNWKIKGDLHQALKDFNEFLCHIKDGEFVKEKELTRKWIMEIERQLSKPSDHVI